MIIALEQKDANMTALPDIQIIFYSVSDSSQAYLFIFTVLLFCLNKIFMQNVDKVLTFLSRYFLHVWGIIKNFATVK
jgi:hypothetical protein